MLDLLISAEFVDLSLSTNEHLSPTVILTSSVNNQRDHDRLLALP